MRGVRLSVRVFPFVRCRVPGGPYSPIFYLSHQADSSDQPQSPEQNFPVVHCKSKSKRGGPNDSSGASLPR